MKKRNLPTRIKLFLVFSCILTACHEPEDIKSVHIFYLPEYLQAALAIRTIDEMLEDTELLKDTTIRSKNFLRSFDREVNKLTPLDSMDRPDLRIWCHIERWNGERHNLLMGSHLRTMYDRRSMHDSPELFKLIHDVIYKDDDIDDVE